MNNRRMSSLSKGLQVIQRFVYDKETWGIREIARELGFSKSAALRLLQSLCDEDFLTLDTKDNKYRICAVGTTVVRTLESSVSTDGYLKSFDGWTNKFIFPPYEFKVPDMMISNFHLPYSTLLMMVSAFAGYDLLFDAYKTAVKEKYRFGTYGDAMLII